MSVSISLLAVLGSPHSVSSADGSAVHELVAAGLRSGDDVVVSFAGIEDVTSAFLNAAIGQLYGEFDEEVIRKHLRVIDTEGDHLVLLKRVVERAKEFFRDPEHYRAAVSGALNE
jgi:hypothetical protein